MFISSDKLSLWNIYMLLLQELYCVNVNSFYLILQMQIRDFELISQNLTYSISNSHLFRICQSHFC